MASRRPVFKDQRTAFWVGIAFYLAGSLALYDAHERRGKDRPFSLRFLPGA
jgi:hypothetical protein